MIDPSQYETVHDMDQELAIAKRIEIAFKCKAEKNPKSYYIDFCCFRNKSLVGWLECRARNNSSTQYPDYLFSARKTIHGLQFAQWSKMPYVLAIQFTDGIFWHEFKPTIKYKIRYMQRSQISQKYRNDPNDNEPCTVITRKMLTRIK